MSYYQNNENNKIRRRKVSSNNPTKTITRDENNYREQGRSKTINRNSNYTNNKNVNNRSRKSKRKYKNKKLRKRKNLKKAVKLLLVIFLLSLTLTSTVGFAFIIASVKDSQKINNATLESNYISSAVATSEEIPKYLKDAIVSIEDERFYKHKGVDYISLVRSVIHNLISNTTQGGSTIEMQISKNLLTNDDKTIKRKIRDMYNALQMNKTMTKDEILVTYLNNIYLAKSSYGVKKGAMEYFGKDVSELSLAQCAMLAGITNNPARYKEYGEAKKRQETILYKMKELGYITDEEYREALRESVSFKSEIE